MWMTTMRIGFSAAACLLMLAASPLRAGGDDYDATAEPTDAGPSFFGFVRDANGAPVANASVLLRPKAGAGVEVKTNTIGLYRTHVHKDAVAAEVEVSCGKDGYRQLRVFRRTAPAPGVRTIETDCTLQRL